MGGTRPYPVALALSPNPDRPQGRRQASQAIPTGGGRVMRYSGGDLAHNPHSRQWLSVAWIMSARICLESPPRIFKAPIGVSTKRRNRGRILCFRHAFTPKGSSGLACFARYFRSSKSFIAASAETKRGTPVPPTQHPPTRMHNNFTLVFRNRSLPRSGDGTQADINRLSRSGTRIWHSLNEHFRGSCGLFECCAPIMALPPPGAHMGGGRGVCGHVAASRPPAHFGART